MQKFLYRMVFGQPRQDDLVAYLLQRLSREEASKHLEDFRIDLSPEAVSLSDSSDWPSAKSRLTGHDNVDHGIDSAVHFGGEAGGSTSKADSPGKSDPSGDLSKDSATESGEQEAVDGTFPIDEIERNEVMATIRDVFWTGGPRHWYRSFVREAGGN